MVLKWNNKGQTGVFFLFMIGIVLFILGFSLASPLAISSAQAMGNLNCSNSSISTDTKVLCGVIDITAPFMVGIIMGLAGMVLCAKLIGGG